jgi:hypothetical protein
MTRTVMTIIALDQVEACRTRVGYAKQFTDHEIANRRFDLHHKIHDEAVEAGIALP